MLTANTPEVRREVGRLLLQNGATTNPIQLRQIVDDTIARIRFVQNVARRTALGFAVAAPGQWRNQ
jgi:hypothetical protein